MDPPRGLTVVGCTLAPGRRAVTADEATDCRRRDDGLIEGQVAGFAPRRVLLFLGQTAGGPLPRGAPPACPPLPPGARACASADGGLCVAAVAPRSVRRPRRGRVARRTVSRTSRSRAACPHARAARAQPPPCGPDCALRRQRMRRGPAGTPWRRVCTREHPRCGSRRGPRFGPPPARGEDLVPAASGCRCARRRRLGVCGSGAANPVCCSGGPTGLGVASTQYGPMGATPVQPADNGPTARALGSVICCPLTLFAADA